MTVELLGDQASSTLCCSRGVPLPVTGSTTGELDALVLTETVAVAAPFAWGVKIKVNGTLVPG